MLIALAALVACYDDDPSISADVATADMRLYINATGDDYATRVTIDVLGPVDRVKLGAGEVLLAGPAETGLRRLERKALVYEGLFSPGVTLVDVELARDEPYDSSQFTFELPAHAELVLPAVASRSQPLKIEWEPGLGGYLSVIQLGGVCFTEIIEDSPVDPGFYVVDPQDLEPSMGTCDVTVTLTRQASMQVPAPNLNRVDAMVSQSMTVTFQSVP